MLRAEILLQTGDEQESNLSALWLLSEFLFLYFLQCRGWPDGKPRFLARLWCLYRRAGGVKDSFVTVWLDRLLTKAAGACDPHVPPDCQRIPDPLHDALARVPALGGGLFLRQQRPGQAPAPISDACFEQVLGFLDAYEYTLSDGPPLEQELAVDPGMAGTAFERLLNAPGNGERRGHSGVFFTPRAEIDLMCRLSLVDWLANHLGEAHRPLLYDAVLALDERGRARADAALAEQELWSPLSDLLQSVTVVDPACGSGSFLVGMLDILDGVRARAADRSNRRQTAYDRKREIVGLSLFGVDVMPLAVEITRMRLWLQLFADVPLDLLQAGSNGSLPNLSMRIRCGDSLVPNVDGLDLVLGRVRELIPTDQAERIAHWGCEKGLFFDNDPACSYRTADQMLEGERSLLSDLVALRITAIKHLEEDEDRHLLTGLQQARLAQRALRSAKPVPFVWDSAFIEVLGQGQRGFDLVIGNPPYLRQELIGDPLRRFERGASAIGKAYKEKLARTVYSVWPNTFGYDWRAARARQSVDARSDLYTYFCFQGLSLLGARGVLCFVVSSAWLDARYGRDLQEFLLTRGRVQMLIENQALRTFARAEINTVIVLLGAAEDTLACDPERLQHLARFVAVSLPFDQAVDSSLWRAVTSAHSRRIARAYRILPVQQGRLLERGTDPEKGSFVGDKWGGKYLRAPEIYWLLLERYQDRLVRLGQVAGVRRGITTGANDFFFLGLQEAAERGIEPQFLVPAVKHPQQCRRIWLERERDSWLYLFVCHQDREELRGTGALRYIAYGESLGIDQRPTCRARRRWWDLGAREGTLLCCNYLVDEIMRFYASSRPMLVGDNFQELHTSLEPSLLAAACNSTICQLFANVCGRSNFGGGLLKLQTYEIRDLWIPNPCLFGAELGQMLPTMGRLALDGDDRRVLDKIVFDNLGLSNGERDAIREAVARMVSNRLGRAQSLRPSAESISAGGTYSSNPAPKKYRK